MKLLAAKKGKIICAALIAALLISTGVILAVVLTNKEYRSISVEAVQGSVIVKNEKNSDQAYKGQRLYGGDDVTVEESSDLTMCMDNNKYLYADENTHFRLEDNSENNASRIRIVLDKGSELNELTEKLNTDESYEVDTPNSTMSVRGTKFRVTVFKGSDGLVYTLLEVEEGVVLVRLKTVTGTYNDVEKEFNADQSALIRADAERSEFVRTESGEIVRALNYGTLPKEAVPRLKALLENTESSDTGKEDSSSGEEKPAPQTIDDSSAEDHTHTPGDFAVTVEPGCETNGEKAAECSVCGETITEEISPLGHDFSDWKVVKEATCQEKGAESRTCSRCGKTETRSLDKTDHSWCIWQTVKEPTCESDGSEERICSSCGEKETRVITAEGAHKWSDFTVDMPAGCTTEGYGHYTCTVCGTKGSSTAIRAAGHSFTAWTVQKAATCQAEGTEIRRCSACGMTESRTIAKTGHSWSAWNTVKQPTCGAAGTEERVCLSGGEKETRSVPATGAHSWGDLITDTSASCSQEGSGHYECTVCGARGASETIPKNYDHQYEEISKVQISDTHYKVTYRCKNCHAEYSATKYGKI